MLLEKALIGPVVIIDHMLPDVTCRVLEPAIGRAGLEPERRAFRPEKTLSGVDHGLAGPHEGRDPAKRESDPADKARVAPTRASARQISLPDPLDDVADPLDDATDPLDDAAERRMARLWGGSALFGWKVAAFFWWVEVSPRAREAFFCCARRLTLWVGGVIQWVSRLVHRVSRLIHGVSVFGDWVVVSVPMGFGAATLWRADSYQRAQATRPH